MSSKRPNKLIKAWQCALPSDFGNLFSFELDGALQRVCKYVLEDAVVDFLVAEASNIRIVSVVLGADAKESVFQPILQIELGKDTFYSPFQLVKSKTEEQFNALVNDEEINPTIAELFILHWQSLTNGELINAFEGLAADKIDSTPKEKTAKIIYSHQKIQRVRKYTYLAEETKVMLQNLANFNQPTLSLCLGSGLKVPNFHPYSFRPILNIAESSKKRAMGGGPSENYDTSIPCPPVCGPF